MISYEKDNLYPLEHKILNSISDKVWTDIASIAENSGLTLDQVRRGLEWLHYKGYVGFSHDKTQVKK